MTLNQNRKQNTPHIEHMKIKKNAKNNNLKKCSYKIHQNYTEAAISII